MKGRDALIVWGGWDWQEPDRCAGIVGGHRMNAPENVALAGMVVNGCFLDLTPTGRR